MKSVFVLRVVLMKGKKLHLSMEVDGITKPGENMLE